MDVSLKGPYQTPYQTYMYCKHKLTFGIGFTVVATVFNFMHKTIHFDTAILTELNLFVKTRTCCKTELHLTN